MTNDDGVLHSRLVETFMDQASPALCQDMPEDLVDNFGEFSISSPNRMWKQLDSVSSMNRFSKSAYKPSNNRGPSPV